MAMVVCKTEVKYKGKYYPAHSPFTIENKDILGFQKLGATLLNLPKVETEEQKEVEKVAPAVPDPVSPLASKTIAQLVALAKEKGIDLGKATKKDDILKIIEKNISED